LIKAEIKTARINPLEPEPDARQRNDALRRLFISARIIMTLGGSMKSHKFVDRSCGSGLFRILHLCLNFSCPHSGLMIDSPHLRIKTI
jgi:hypothetical protein